MMMSYTIGKDEVVRWIRDNFPAGSTILDVGAGDGVWRRLLPEYTMDAVEIFPPNAARLEGYRQVFNADAIGFTYDRYDLIIFGDVIEHMTVEDAKSVLAYAWPRCRDMVVAVPYLYEQGPLYGNQWERHIQADLTPAIFDERYPGFAIIYQNMGWDYCYYHKGENDERDKNV